MIARLTRSAFGRPVIAGGRTGTTHVAYDYTFGDLLREFGSSLVLDVVLGGLGAVLGILVATIVRRRRVSG